MSLQDKYELSRQFLLSLRSDYDPARIAVAWTGGKDSTVVLGLWRAVLGDTPVLAVNLDTGCKFPEIIAFRDHWAAQWGLNLLVARPDPEAVLPVLARDTLACCGALKIEPLKRAIRQAGIEVLLTGIRADEHPSRSDMAMLETRCDPDHRQANPILHWTEMDVWAHTMAFGLPYCDLYNQGYRSLGCMPCTVQNARGGERAGRDQDKEAQMASLRALGYF